MVEQINREFKMKQQALQPLMTELKQIRQRYLELEQVYLERKSGTYSLTHSLTHLLTHLTTYSLTHSLRL